MAETHGGGRGRGAGASRGNGGGRAGRGRGRGRGGLSSADPIAAVVVFFVCVRWKKKIFFKRYEERNTRDTHTV